MNGKNNQNQIVKIKQLIKSGYIENGVRQADLLIKQNKTVRELSHLIKKTLIKNRILEKQFSLSKVETLIKEKSFACAKYLIKNSTKKINQNSKIFYFLGKIYVELNETENAISSFEASKNLDPNNLSIRKDLANLHLTIGNLDKSIEIFNHIKEKDPFDGENHRLLSRTKKYLSDKDDHIKQMEGLVSSSKINNEQKINIAFALGNIYENLSMFDRSAIYYKIGNEKQNERLKFDLEKEKFIIKNIINVFNSLKIKELQNFGSQNTKPIFILGMPRSGTTLLEQILSSHSEVYGGGELSFIEDFLLLNRGPIGLRLPVIFNNPNEENINKFCAYYMDRINYINNDKTYITDKMPGNFKWIGLIKSAFPNSKIIHVKRNKMDTCFSIYKSYFANDTCSYSYDSKNLADFFNLYELSMKNWQKIFKNEIYNCNYEKLVNNIEDETRKVLSYCELKWDENVLNFHKNKRRVMTVSSAQIREKIYNKSINSWKNYKKELKNLFENL